MTDEKTQEKAAKALGDQGVADAPCEEKPRRKRSVGELAFDWSAYGFTGVVTLIAGVIPGYFFRYGKGVKVADPIIKNLVKTGLSRSAAEDAVITTTLMTGGFVTLPLIKTLEDNKMPFIEDVNEAVGCETDRDAIGKEHRQTWNSLLKSRAKAWAMVFASFRGVGALIGAEKFAQFEKDFSKNVVCQPLGKATHINGQETKLFKYGRIAALDVFATMAATVLLYIGSRIFAKNGDHTHEPEPCTESPQKETVMAAAAPVNVERNDKAKPFVERINVQEQELMLTR